MDQKGLDRINALARKSKTVGLTTAEKAEQKVLREQFLADFRKNFTASLDKIDIQEPDGTIINLGEKYGHKKK